MGKPRVSAGGGFAAILYSLRMGRQAGGLWRLFARLRSRNACKTCALGMGGQKGGMVNEAGTGFEVCKKSMQAQAGDMQGAIPETFFSTTPLARMERFTSRDLERLGRLAFPVMAAPGDTHFRRIPWEEGISRTAGALRQAPPSQAFFYMSGRASNEAAFLMQLVARAYGTRNIHNCSYYCHSASGVALGQVYGSGTSSVTLDDLATTDLVVLVGANPASNHPRLITQLMHLKRRGGRIIVVNPLRELGLVKFRVPSDWRSLLFGSSLADLYVQPHAGGDVAFAKALLKGLIEARGVDHAFVRDHTTGFDAVAKDVEAEPWDRLLSLAGVTRPEVDRAVEMLFGAERGVVMWAMGLTHHAHGVDNILALANVALARGWIGRPGAGLMPIRGHSNVQGVGSMGVSPELKTEFAARLFARYGVQSDGAGQDTFASMQAAERGDIRASVQLGGNLYGSNPDAAWARRALMNIPLTLSITTKLNTGHVQGRGQTMILLPALARDEETQPTTQESMFSYVRLSEGGSPAVPGEMRSEVEIIAALAQGILDANRFDWDALRSHAELRRAIAACVPGYAALGDIDATRAEFHVEGRRFHAPPFATADGRARFCVTPTPAGPPAGAFRLITLRSEGQFNTVVYENEDLYRGNRRRDVVMMAAADAVRLGLREGDRVRVTSDAGAMEASVAVVAIRAGNLAMYYPEANVLVPARIDPRSKTPAFKSVTARVEPQSARRPAATSA